MSLHSIMNGPSEQGNEDDAQQESAVLESAQT